MTAPMKIGDVLLIIHVMGQYGYPTNIQQKLLNNAWKIISERAPILDGGAA